MGIAPAIIMAVGSLLSSYMASRASRAAATTAATGARRGSYSYSPTAQAATQLSQALAAAGGADKVADAITDSGSEQASISRPISPSTPKQEPGAVGQQQQQEQPPQPMAQANQNVGTGQQAAPTVQQSVTNSEDYNTGAMAPDSNSQVSGTPTGEVANHPLSRPVSDPQSGVSKLNSPAPGYGQQAQGQVQQQVQGQQDAQHGLSGDERLAAIKAAIDVGSAIGQPRSGGHVGGFGGGSIGYNPTVPTSRERLKYLIRNIERNY